VNDQTNQQNLVITRSGDAAITVDNIKVAQFVYLLLNNKEIRDVIDTIGKKAVLILGRFSEERKAVLDAIRDELRNHDYLPIMFDFTPSPNRSTLDTIKTLAGMAKFVIADLTDARSVNQEVDYIVENLPSVAVRLIRKKSARKYGMRDSDILRLSLVKDTYEYKNIEEVIASIEAKIISPAEEKVKELRRRLENRS
jgi:ribosomal protein L12E/L44/L45/RPP1/RPP2